MYWFCAFIVKVSRYIVIGSVYTLGAGVSKQICILHGGLNKPFTLGFGHLVVSML